MAYRLPTFNMIINVWRFPGPVTGPITFQFTGQLRASLRPAEVTPTGLNTTFPWEILAPALTDIRDGFDVSQGDYVEAPAGSGRHYQILYVDDIAKGFPNEHRVGIIVKYKAWPSPIP
jgi:hypothetical protein